MVKLKNGEKLRLHIPALDELGFRQKMMADPETMAYNAGYDLAFSGFNGKNILRGKKHGNRE